MLRRIGRLVARLRGKPIIPPGVIVGERVHIGHGVNLDWSHGHHIVIEDDVVIAQGVRILAHDASTRRTSGWTWVAPVKVSRRAFIGADSVILPGVTIGPDAVVGAGSVVSRNVAAGAVVAGSPARQISTVLELGARREAMMRDGVPAFDERLYNVHPIQPALLQELQDAASNRGGYFLGIPVEECDSGA